jgi:hypothetical protein
MENGNMQTDQIKKHIQLLTEGTAEDDDLGNTPAPAAGSPTPATPDQLNRLRAWMDRMDKVLKKFNFESVDFDSLSESEQQQLIMKNLHLLSESDQMAVLRDLMSEGWKKTAGKWVWDEIIKPVGSGVLGLTKDIAKFGAKVGILGGGALGGIWAYKSLFPPAKEISAELPPDVEAELQQLEQEYNQILPPNQPVLLPPDVQNQLKMLASRAWAMHEAQRKKREEYNRVRDAGR